MSIISSPESSAAAPDDPELVTVGHGQQAGFLALHARPGNWRRQSVQDAVSLVARHVDLLRLSGIWRRHVRNAHIQLFDELAQVYSIAAAQQLRNLL